LRALEREGRTVKRIRVLENIEDVNAWNQSIAASEMARTHAVWFKEHETLYRPRTAAADTRRQGALS